MNWIKGSSKKLGMGRYQIFFSSGTGTSKIGARFPVLVPILEKIHYTLIVN